MKSVTIKAMSAHIVEGTLNVTNADKEAASERVVYLQSRNNQDALRNDEQVREHRATALAIVNALANIGADGIADGKADAMRRYKANDKTLAYSVVATNVLTNGGTDEAANMRLKDDGKHAGIADGTVRRMTHPTDGRLSIVYRSRK